MPDMGITYPPQEGKITVYVLTIGNVVSVLNIIT
jgi:hypothetical protein